MPEKAKHKIGDSVEVKEGTTVLRPDGEEVTVSGGLYVLTQPGTYRVGDEEMETKA
jgi:hypothetical protein